LPIMERTAVVNINISWGLVFSKDKGFPRIKERNQNGCRSLLFIIVRPFLTLAINIACFKPDATVVVIPNKFPIPHAIHISHSRLKFSVVVTGFNKSLVIIWYFAMEFNLKTLYILAHRGDLIGRTPNKQ